MMTPHNGILLAILTSIIYAAILYGRYRGRADAWAKGHKYWNLAYRAGWDTRNRVPTGTTAAVYIGRSGWVTPRPQVHVSVRSRHASGGGGGQSIYSYDADDVGEAKATLYGKSLAEILGVPLIDERSADNG